MKYATLILVLLALGCQPKASTVVSTESVDEAQPATAAPEKPEPQVFTQTTFVKAYESARCERLIECFPEGLAPKVLNFGDTEECMQNRVADMYDRRDAEGKPMFCESGSAFKADQASKCLDWMQNMHCGEFIQVFMQDAGAFHLCNFVCVTND